MLYQNEKTEIINQLLNSFKGRETDLVNYIIYSVNNNFHLLNHNYFNDKIYSMRQALRKVPDLKKVDTFSEIWLNDLDYSILQNIQSYDENKFNIFININEIKNIINDKRLLNLLKRYGQYTDYFFNYESNFLLDELYLNDFFNIQKIILSKASKELVLTDIDYRYSKLINHNKNLKKYMTNEDFLIWAYQYLNKKNTYSLNPATIKNEYIESINLYFDLTYFHNEMLYETEIDSIKKAWRQKKFRDQGKVKKAYHLPLTKKAKKELTLLANMNNLSENSMLEQLIHKAHTDQLCDENGKPIY